MIDKTAIDFNFEKPETDWLHFVSFNDMIYTCWQKKRLRTDSKSLQFREEQIHINELVVQSKPIVRTYLEGGLPNHDVHVFGLVQQSSEYIFSYYIDRLTPEPLIVNHLYDPEGTLLKYRKGNGHFCFVSYSNGVILVHLGNDQQVRAYVFPWDRLKPKSQAKATGVYPIGRTYCSYFPLDKYYEQPYMNGIVYHGYDTNPAERVERLCLVLSRRTSIVAIGECDIKPDGTLPANGLIVTESPLPEEPPPSQYNGIPLDMHIGIDGCLYLGIGEVVTDGSIQAVHYYCTSGHRRQWKKEASRFSGSDSQRRVIGVALRNICGGITDEKKSDINAELTDATMPVYQVPLTVFYPKANPGKQVFLHVDCDDSGLLKRRALGVEKGQKGVLIGIVQGPPPLPQENINISGPNPNKSEVRISVTKSQSNYAEHEWHAGFVASASCYLNTWYQMKLEAEVKALYRGLMSKQQKITEYMEYFSHVMIDEGKILPQGTVFLAYFDWTGYAYEYINGGNPVTTASKVLELFPHKVSISVLSYAMNPEAGPIPGNLDTYKLSPAEQTALRVKLGSEEDHLYNGWSITGDIKKSWECYTEQELVHGCEVTAMMAYEQGLKLEYKGYGGFSTSLRATILGGYNYKNKQGGSEKVGFAVDIDTNGSMKVIGSYISFNFDTYMLETDNQWTKHFLDNLVTPTFPQDPIQRKQNIHLLEIIDPASRPWKIVYQLRGTPQKVGEKTENEKS